MRTRAAIHFAAAVYYAQIAAADDDQLKCVDAAGNELAADKCSGDANPGNFFMRRRNEPPIDSVEKREVPSPHRIKRGGFGTPATLAARAVPTSSGGVGG
ncbi:hypothetical protein PspLS_07046 [Pyricularia sp. CBS 133598]|nr:hypothetical protein PspLS_07046 [Pyricularia sp. CBS 133598]